MDTRLNKLRAQYPTYSPEESNLLPGKLATSRELFLRNAAEPQRAIGKTWVIDTLFPQTLTGRLDTSGVDEGSADLLYGFVRGLQPHVVLETGTHKGRSTRAIVTALHANNEIDIMPYSLTVYTPIKGHCYTIDAEDHGIIASGAIPTNATEYVTTVIGWTPDVFSQVPLKDLQGIEFAFLDGDHSDEGLLAELDYVDTHRAPECWVVVDNSRDVGWPNLQTLLSKYTKYPRVSLGTCTGLDLIWMR